MKSHLWLLSLSVFLSAVGLKAMAQEQAEEATSPDNEQLLKQIEESDFESLFDISIEHNVDWEVGTPTKIAKRSSRSPASVTVISHEQINLFGYKSVAQVLEHIAGFSSTSDLVQTSFGIRGIHPGARAGNRNFKVMLDGQAVSFSATSQNFIDENLLPISMVERIEVVKGPVSALYGANAFLGVVNIVTKSAQEYIRKGNLVDITWRNNQGGDDGYFVEFSGGDNYAGWDTRYGFATGKTDISGLNLPKSSPQFVDFDNASSTHTISRDANNKPLSLYIKSNYVSQEQAKWQVTAHYQQLNSDSPFADINALRNSGYSRIGLYNGFLAVKHVRQLDEDLSLNLHLGYKKGGPLSQDKLELGSEQFFYKRNIAYNSYDVSAEFNWMDAKANHWLFGVDYSWQSHDLETFSRIEKSDGSSSPLSEPISKSVEQYAAYMQWLGRWSHNIETIIGLRFDRSDVFDEKVSYRLGMVYPLFDRHSIKLLLGSSYQAPSMELLYRQPVQRGDVIGNPHLKPQEAQTVELVLSGKFGKHSRYNLTTYRSSVDDLVVYRDDQNNLSAINAAKADTHGVELELGYDSDRFNAYFNVGWQIVHMGDSSLFILENRPNGELFPKYTVSGGMSYLWDNQVRLSLNNRFNSARPASTNNVLAAETFYEIDAFWDTTLTLSRKFKWFGQYESEVKLQLQDLWDHRFISPGFGGIDIPTMGRQISLSFSQRF